jgi:hypothetical protein
VISMMNIKEIEFNNEGKIVSLKGTVEGKKIKANRLMFSKITNKIIYWAELELDYAGG